MGISKFIGLEVILAVLLGVSAIPKTNLFFEITKAQIIIVIGVMFITHWIEAWLETRKPSSESADDSGIDNYFKR